MIRIFDRLQLPLGCLARHNNISHQVGNLTDTSRSEPRPNVIRVDHLLGQPPGILRRFGIKPGLFNAH